MSRAGALSNQDIEQLLGKEIFIYPYKRGNSNGGATYNLTASCFAYYIKEEQKIYAVENNKIKIPPHTTVLIQTDEAIHVSNKICGTYHSKVSLVSDGLGHIGTTLDPMYFGTSKIAIQNTSDTVKFIDVGKTFVSIMFHKTVSKAKSRHDNGPGRLDIMSVDINELKNADNENIAENVKQALQNWQDREYYNNLDSLRDKVVEEKNKSTLGKREKNVDTVCFIISLFLSLIPIISAFIYWIFKPEWLAALLNNENIVALILAIAPLPWVIVNLINNFIKSCLKGG